MKITMEAIMAARKAGVDVVPGGFHAPEGNKFRMYCKLRGFKGKEKKRLRRAIRERELKKASAMNALPTNNQLEGLFREAQNPIRRPAENGGGRGT